MIDMTKERAPKIEIQRASQLTIRHKCEWQNILALNFRPLFSYCYTKGLNCIQKKKKEKEKCKGKERWKNYFDKIPITKMNL